MTVDAVYVNTYKKDFHQARVCVASVRYWYPHIPIYLVKDTASGDFDTGPMERCFNVKTLETGNRPLGWGFGSFEVLFMKPPRTFLLLDGDTVMSGPLLDRLSKVDADFIVDEEVQPPDKLKDLYYDPNLISEIDPSFTYPGYSFNAGQLFGTAGKLSRVDFDPFIKWEPRPVIKHPHVFMRGHQGVLNYIVQRKQSEGMMKVARIPIMIWPEHDAAGHIDLEGIRRREVNEDRIIHWAGMKHVPFKRLPRRDIIQFFRDEYYRRTGLRQRIFDAAAAGKDRLADLLARIVSRILRPIRPRA